MTRLEQVRLGIVKKMTDHYLKDFCGWTVDYDWDRNEVQWVPDRGNKTYIFDAREEWPLENAKVLDMAEETGLFPEIIADGIKDTQDDIFEFVMGRKPGGEHGDQANS